MPEKHLHEWCNVNDRFKLNSPYNNFLIKVAGRVALVSGIDEPPHRGFESKVDSLFQRKRKPTQEIPRGS